MLGDSLAVPSQQRFGRHDPAFPPWAGESGGDRSEEGPVFIGERGSANLASQDGVLVAKNNDLKVLGPAGTHGETCNLGKEAVEQPRHDRPGWQATPLVSAHASVFERHRGKADDFTKS